MFDDSLEDDLDELSSAEDFLEYFEVPFEASVVHVNRLHILQRFHDYLTQVQMPQDEAARRALYAEQLQRAYGDFVNSDARTEKVLKIYKQSGPQVAFVSVDQLRRGSPA